MERDLSWLVGELRALAGDLNADEERLPLVLAIDQGGHASRVIAFDIAGKQHAESFAPISTFRSGNDRVEHDALEIVASIRTALADVAQALGVHVDRVVAAGLATQRSSIVCWDSRTGHPLSPVLSWQDRRASNFLNALRAREAAIRNITGLVLSPHYGASKLRWCLDNLDKVANAKTNLRLNAGPLASFLMFALLAERPRLIDPANASRTLLWDVHTANWSAELLQLFGIPRDILPSCVASRHAFGHLPFGSRSIPLIVCTGDQSAMPFAGGRIDVDAIYLNVGTGAFLQRLTNSQIPDDRLLRSILWADEHAQMRTQEGTVNAAAGALDWLNERVGIDTHRAAAAMTIENAAQNVPIFINTLSGVGSPYWIAQAEARLIGTGTEAAQVQAVVESIAFLICVNIERMRATQNITHVIASGGLSASDYLCECVAALSGIAVERMSIREATASGLAYLVAGMPEIWRRTDDPKRFPPKSLPELTSRFAQWRSEMDQLSAR